jgi:hypothetical protein
MDGLTESTTKLGTAAGKTSNQFRNLLGGTGESAKKAKTELDSFLGGLEKQLAALEIKQIELRTGPQGALAASLDRELQTFKEKLRANQLPIPKGLEEFFQNLKSRILAANEELTRTTFEMERLDAIGQAMSGDSAEWLNVGDDLEKARKDAADLAKQFDKLRSSLAIEAIDTSTPEGREQQRIASITVEFAQTAAEIEELGRKAGKTQEEIAEAIELAWKKASNEIFNTTDELTKFQERAFERIHDVIADNITDALQGNIKTWEEWGDSVKRVLDSLVAEFLALQLKTALFGKSFGAPSAGGGQVGGLIGQLIGAAGSFFGGGGTAAIPSAGVDAAAQTGGAIGDILNYHQGGPVAKVSAAVLPKFHGGGEVPAMLQDGEFVLKKWSAARIGRPRLDYMNATGTIPPDTLQSSGGRGAQNINININSPDADGFRRSRTQIASDISRAVRKGDKYN